MALSLFAVTGCEIGTVAVPITASRVVVHAVLNPGASTQVVLLERTLTGTINVPDTIFDPTDPIVSAGGIPVSGATVEIIDSAGVIVRGTEDLASSDVGKGAGVYHVPLAGSLLVVGARYQLHVTTADGEELTASTRIPRATNRQNGGLSRMLNRDHDAVLAAWTATEGARSYAIRIESPFGPFFLFTDSTSIRISGDLRNLFANNLEHVFIPGFRQDMIIAAVDSNFYDYYRTNNDPFTGAGIISRINGGLGLFGSLVSLNTGTLTITADQTESIEGRYRLDPSTNDPTMPTLIQLYIESPGARDDLPSALSGRYSLGNSTTRGDGMTGKLQGTTISLAFLQNQLAGDTVDVFEGEVYGDTLRGNFIRRPGDFVFVKQP